MKKIILLHLLACTTATLQAQTGLNAMVNAERRFAAHAVANSTMEAFLLNIDSSSLMFQQGKPVAALEFWKQRTKNQSVLNWWPQYAEVSLSGDFGYTTGPWTYQAKAADTIAARGYFATVWYLNTNREWKFLIDLGVDDVPAPADTSLHTISGLSVPMADDGAITRIFPMIAAENQYKQALASGKQTTAAAFLSSQSVLLRNGQPAAATTDARKKIIAQTPKGIKYQLEGWNISSTPDIGYVYGTATYNGKAEGFFRVWRLEKTGWRIALEVVRY